MRYAICNETFEGWDFGRICDLVAGLGYQGLELAPFTLAPRITDLSSQARRSLLTRAKEHGLAIVGLHWLLARTEGLQITSPDEVVRQQTADYLVELARCCRDLEGEVLVFGSPGQRRIPTGATRRQAADWAADTFQRALARMSGLGVKICLEPLGPAEADFINTCAEAVELIDRVDHPDFILHLDAKALASEREPSLELIRRHGSRAGHFHANDPNRRGPGFGELDFVPIFDALRQVGYSKWVSVEVFDYAPDPETIARESLKYMQECAAQVERGRALP